LRIPVLLPLSVCGWLGDIACARVYIRLSDRASMGNIVIAIPVLDNSVMTDAEIRIKL
jgi:hypothetical protein